MSSNPNPISLDSFDSLLDECSKCESSKTIIDEIVKLTKEVPFLMKQLKTSSQSLFNESSYNSLQAIVDKYDQPDVLYILAQFFNKLLYPENFDLICLDEIITIHLLYLMLNCIEKNKGGFLCHLLIRKAQIYMKYLFKRKKANKQMLSELMKAFPIYHSLTFKKFNTELNKSKVIDFCNSIVLKDKEEGVNILSALISENVFFAEQIELLYLSAPTVLASLLKAPKEDEVSVYNKFANFLCQLLYYTSYKIVLKDNDDDKSPIDSKIIYVLNDQKTTEMTDLKFLDEKIYELTYQKEFLELNDSIVEICILFVSSVSNFDKNFRLQFMCYLILRKIYFLFPKYNKDIGDYLPFVLTSLCKFQGQTEWNKSLECREFAFYLLTRDQQLKTKIKCSTAVPQKDIRYPEIALKNIGLAIGFPQLLPLNQREVVEKKIEVNEPNSIVYISISEEEDRDIIISLYKCNSESKGYNCILDKEKVNGDGKIVLIANEPGLYFMRFDNSSSWFKERKLKYQFVYLKASK